VRGNRVAGAHCHRVAGMYEIFDAVSELNLVEMGFKDKALS
jgi:hypothetical protein